MKEDEGLRKCIEVDAGEGQARTFEIAAPPLPQHALGLAGSAHPRPLPTVQRPQTSALLVLVFPTAALKRRRAGTPHKSVGVAVWRASSPRTTQQGQA